MKKSVKRIVVTGGAGQICYNLLFRIASGDLLGTEQPVSLNILELPASLEALKGVVMELNDCAFPLLESVQAMSDPYAAYEGVDIALLVGAKPRGPGMERKDLLSENGKIFVEQGKAINKGGHKESIVLVVGNPCNTNALVTLHHAPDIPRENFFAMTRLDQNRATFQLAQKANVHHREVEGVVVWGNHSSTQVPDFTRATCRGKPLTELITDEEWLKGDFFKTVQQRGAAIIAARGKSSAASAASAAIDSIRSLTTPSKCPLSAGVFSNGNPYGIEEDLIFSFPLQCTGYGKWKIEEEWKWNDFFEEKIKLTEKELREERDFVKELLR